MKILQDLGGVIIIVVIVMGGKQSPILLRSLNLRLEGDKKGVNLEMKSKEFFAMLHQLESARYALQGVSNNEGWISCRLFTYADLVDLEKAI